MLRPTWQRFSVVLLLIAFALTGCTGGKKTEKDPPKDPVELVMTYSNFGYISRNVLDDIIRDYERKNTHVRIRMVEFRGPERRADGTWDFSALEKADLLLLSGSNARGYYNQGLLRDLSQVPQPNWDPLVSPFVETISVVDGVRVMMPMMLTTDRMFYHPEIFQELGLPAPSPNWTYAEFEDLLRQLKDAGRPADMYYYSLVDHLLRASGGGFYDASAGKWAFDTPANRQALSTLTHLVEEELVFTEFDSSRSTFGPNASPLTNAIIYPQPQGYDWIPYPKGPAGRKSNIGAQGIAVTASTPHPEEAMAFMQALVSGEVALRSMAAAGHRPLVENGDALTAWRDKVGAEQANLTDEVIADGWTNPGVVSPVSYHQEVLDLLQGKRGLEDLLMDLDSRVN